MLSNAIDYNSNSPSPSLNFLKEYKIVLIGDGGVGKSALTIQFIQSTFISEYDPTIEDSYRKQVIVDGNAVLLDILDTAGQEAYSAMRDQYMKSGEGFICVYSVDSRSSFESIPDFYKQISRSKDFVRFPFILVANKCDKRAESKVVSTQEGLELAKRLGVPFIECSAKFGINVNELFFGIVREIKRNINSSIPSSSKISRKKCCIL